MIGSFTEETGMAVMQNNRSKYRFDNDRRQKRGKRHDKETDFKGNIHDTQHTHLFSLYLYSAVCMDVFKGKLYGGRGYFRVIRSDRFV